MAQISRPWQGRTSLGAVGDAGPYSAAQWRLMYRNLLGHNTDLNHYGVIQNIGNVLAVVAQGVPNNTVILKSGAALVRGAFYFNDADITITVPANASGSARIDTVILRYSETTQTVRQAYLQGTPGSSMPATLTQSGTLWEIPIAYITVANGFVSIADSVISSGRHFANVPTSLGLPFTAVSPASVGQGTLYGTTVFGGSLMNPTIQGDPGGGVKVFGALAEDYYQSGTPKMVTHGLSVVAVAAAVTQGQYLRVTPAGVTGSSTPEDSFGVAMTSTTGAGKVLAYVNFLSKNESPYMKYLDVTSGSITSGAWRTRTLSVESTDTNGLGSVAGGQITIQPGVYECRFGGGAYAVNQHQTRLQNITAGATLLHGKNAYSAAAAVVVTMSEGEGRFTLNTASVLELQHQCNTTNANANAMGIASGFAGTTDIYGFVELWRICSLD